MCWRLFPAVFRHSVPLRVLHGFWLAVFVLLLIYVLVLSGLLRDSLWGDEAWTAWAVRSPFVSDMLARVRMDVHPPLYFALMDGWTLAAGDSPLALRLPSVWAGLVALATVYALGRRLFDAPAGLLALILLGTSGFFIYYAREARMYTLLLALAALATLLYWRWQSRRGLWRGLIYGVVCAALVYTHYAGVLVVGVHVLHGLLTRGRAMWRSIVPYGIALALFAPWLPTLADQLRANPAGPLAVPVATDAAAVAALSLLLTADQGWLSLLILSGAVALAVWQKRWTVSRRMLSPLLLSALLFLLTPAVLLGLNALWKPVYQVRYAIALLVGWALLLGAVLRSWAGQGGRQWVLSAGLLFALILTQLSGLETFWPPKPPWEAALREVSTARAPLEPIVTDFAPYSPAAYYERLLGLRRGITLDLSWRLHTPAEVRGLADVLQAEARVWAALPVNTAKSWQMMALLGEIRGVSYRAALGNMVFYGFDASRTDRLRYRFGDVLRLDEAPDAGTQFSIRRGETLCVAMNLRSLQVLDERYSLGLHLIDQTGTVQAAAWDEGLGGAEADHPLEVQPCLTPPSDVPAGHYHLQAVVYEWATGQRLSVIEDGGGEGVIWGDVLVLAAVDVTE